MHCKRSSDRAVLALTLLGMLIFVSSCASEVIPKELEGQVDRKVTFLQLKEAPATYTGRMVVLGGEVLSAKRGNDSTRIEVLQLPLDSSLEPVPDRTTSQGRVLAIQKAFLDPATVPVGSDDSAAGDGKDPATPKLREANTAIISAGRKFPQPPTRSTVETRDTSPVC